MCAVFGKRENLDPTSQMSVIKISIKAKSFEDPFYI